ncbi:MAG: MBL fold metallo-hydrolase [Chloroflexi bacterium]|nr:MBL fold metallo-hydrolase [Chloroflexota bacterium]
MIRLAFDHGILLPDMGLWLDPSRGQDFAFISHAHSDHVRRHQRVIVSPGTQRFLQLRSGPHARDLGPAATHVLPFGQRTWFDAGFHATLYPAGHVLGSAQILTERDGARLLYSGDFKLREGPACEPIQVPRADTLVMESTFGRPHYLFPPRAEVVADIIAFCKINLARGRVPVLLGYSLGKGPELLASLAEAGFDFALHEALFSHVQLYQELGVHFPEHVQHTPGTEGGRVLLFPPSVRRSHLRQRVPGAAIAHISGWAVDRGTSQRLGVDAAFPLSDHADYRDLLEYVERVQPREVYTVHGFAAELARDLQRRGWNARALKSGQQLKLL